MRECYQKILSLIAECKPMLMTQRRGWTAEHVSVFCNVTKKHNTGRLQIEFLIFDLAILPHGVAFFVVSFFDN